MQDFLTFLTNFNGQTPDYMSTDMEPAGDLSIRIQEVLGAREPDAGGKVKDILSSRFDPEDFGTSYGDYANSAIGILHDKYAPAQEYANDRVSNALKSIGELTRASYYAGGGGGNATIKAAQMLMANDPNLDFADAFSIAKSGVGVGNTVSNGQVQNIGGAPGAFGNLEYGKKSGMQRAELDYAAPIAAAATQGKVQGEIAGNIDKKNQQADTSRGLTAEARKYLPNATGSTVGAGFAAGKKFFGVSDAETQANAKLDIIGAQLVQQVPRFEGPQSNYDVASYREAAGRVADRTSPIADRLAALDIIDALNAKYGTQAAVAQPSALRTTKSGITYEVIP